MLKVSCNLIEEFNLETLKNFRRDSCIKLIIFKIVGFFAF
jgi:hypothetical protein